MLKFAGLSLAGELLIVKHGILRCMMKPGDLVKYIPTSAELPMVDRLGIIIGISGFCFRVLWSDMGTIESYTQDSLEAINETRRSDQVQK